MRIYTKIDLIVVGASDPKDLIYSKKTFLFIKGRVHCFSMQIVINKCFLLNPEKSVSFSRKTQETDFYPVNSFELISLAFGSVTSFFGIKVCVFFLNDKTDLRHFF